MTDYSKDAQAEYEKRKAAESIAKKQPVKAVASRIDRQAGFINKPVVINKRGRQVQSTQFYNKGTDKPVKVMTKGKQKVKGVERVNADCALYSPRADGKFINDPAAKRYHADITKR